MRFLDHHYQLISTLFNIVTNSPNIFSKCGSSEKFYLTFCLVCFFPNKEATARHNHPVSLPHQHSVSSSDEVRAREDSTRVRYTVATQNENSSNQALDILQRLSKNSANVVEVIQDDRLRNIEPEMVDIYTTLYFQ